MAYACLDCGLQHWSVNQEMLTLQNCLAEEEIILLWINIPDTDQRNHMELTRDKYGHAARITCLALENAKMRSADIPTNIPRFQT